MNDSPYAREATSFSAESLSRLGRLVRKELTEILRDRRTILTLVLMPLLLYPLLTLAFQQYFMASSLQLNNDFRLAFTSQQDWDEFASLMGFENDADGFARVKENPADKPEKPADKKPPRAPVRFKAITGDDLEQMVRKGDADLGVRLRNLDDVLNNKAVALEAEFIYQPESSAALTAQAVLERALALRNSARLESILKRNLAIPKEITRRNRSLQVVNLIAQTNIIGRLWATPPLYEPIRLPPQFTRPQPKMVKIFRAPLERSISGQLISIAALVPFILILMTITGAVYPAIDLTAGERERGTLEILVAAPVPRLALLFAKYVAVLSVAVLTALINMSAMFITLKLSGWGQLLIGDGEISAGHIFSLLGLLVLFAGFFSAVLLVITSFARSFKEAQAYLIPLMLASLGPGLAGMIPGLSLDGALAVTPLVNIVLLARDVFDGTVTPLSVALVVSSTLLYAVAALTVAARIFGAEEVLYNEQSGWSDLLHRSHKVQPAASLSNALVCLAVMVPVNFVLRGIVISLGEPDVAGMLIFMCVDSLLLFVLLPGLSAYWSRLNWQSGFSLGRPGWLAPAGGLLLGLGLWAIVLQLMWWLKFDLPGEVREQAERLAEQMKSAGLWIAVPLGLAALTEELFFRGYLFAALERLARPATVIVVTAVLFGVMHGIVGGSIGSQQVVPAILMGLVLGTVRWRSGSVVPGMLLHLAHNVTLAVLQVSLGGAVDEKEPPLKVIAEMLGVQPYELVAALAATVLAGAFLVYWGGRKLANGRGVERSTGPILADELRDKIIELR